MKKLLNGLGSCACVALAFVVTACDKKAETDPVKNESSKIETPSESETAKDAQPETEAQPELDTAKDAPSETEAQPESDAAKDAQPETDTHPESDTAKDMAPKSDTTAKSPSKRKHRDLADIELDWSVFDSYQDGGGAFIYGPLAAKKLSLESNTAKDAPSEQHDSTKKAEDSEMKPDEIIKELGRIDKGDKKDGRKVKEELPPTKYGMLAD